MDITPEIRAHYARIGKLGGDRRKQTLSARRIRQIAIMGGKAPKPRRNLAAKLGTNAASNAA